MEIRGITNVGKVRKNNQDCYYIGENWCILADGMGGHNGGETASATAVQVAISYLRDHPLDFEGVIPSANRMIYELSNIRPELDGMGTTVVLAAIDEGHVQIFNVGDSRAYQITQTEIKQLTKDHSVVEELIEQGSITREEAKNHPQRNLITRAVGTSPDVETDMVSVRLEQDETILLCTDGLTNMLEEDHIRNIVQTLPAEQALELLVEEANNAGGMDNITIILIQSKTNKLFA